MKLTPLFMCRQMRAIPLSKVTEHYGSARAFSQQRTCVIGRRDKIACEYSVARRESRGFGSEDPIAFIPELEVVHAFVFLMLQGNLPARDKKWECGQACRSILGCRPTPYEVQSQG